MSENDYKIGAICDNCDFKGEVDIPKGVLIKDALCPKCGNASLRKSLPGEV